MPIVPRKWRSGAGGHRLQVLLDDRKVLTKWWRTATLIFERLRDEHDCQEDAKMGTMRPSN